MFFDERQGTKKMEAVTKNGNAIKEIAGILAVGIMRMKKKGLLDKTDRNMKNKNLKERKSVC